MDNSSLTAASVHSSANTDADGSLYQLNLPGSNSQSGVLAQPNSGNGSSGDLGQPVTPVPAAGAIGQICPSLSAISSIPGGWVIPPVDKKGNPIYVQVLNKKIAQLTQFYNSTGDFGLPVGSTIQAASSLPMNSQVQILVSNNYDFANYKLINPCSISAILDSPAVAANQFTYCDSFDSVWNGSLQQQDTSAGITSGANADSAISQEIADLQQCSNLATSRHSLGMNTVNSELFRETGGLTRIGFDTNNSIVGTMISNEVSRTIASDLKECAAAINQKYRDVLVGFKPCQCGHLASVPADVP